MTCHLEAALVLVSMHRAAWRARAEYVLEYYWLMR